MLSDSCFNNNSCCCCCERCDVTDDAFVQREIRILCENTPIPQSAVQIYHPCVQVHSVQTAWTVTLGFPPQIHSSELRVSSLQYATFQIAVKKKCIFILSLNSLCASSSWQMLACERLLLKMICNVQRYSKRQHIVSNMFQAQSITEPYRGSQSCWQGSELSWLFVFAALCRVLSCSVINPRAWLQLRSLC